MLIDVLLFRKEILMSLDERCQKYRDVILYAIFGVLTTIINIVSFYVLTHLFNISIMVSTLVAWILAVLFAYLTNRKWVFSSYAVTNKEKTVEVLKFFLMRLFTGIVDWSCMLIFVEILAFDEMVIKCLANVLVIVLNYIASKLIIFRRDSQDEK